MRWILPALGLGTFVTLAWLLGTRAKKPSLRLLVIAIGMQGALAWLLLHLPILSQGLGKLAQGVQALETASKAGASFVFGYLGGGPPPFEVTQAQHSFIVAFGVLPMVIVVSSLSALLYHWRILPWIIRQMGRILSKTLHIGGVEGFGVSASVFLGIIETPLLIRPYLSKMPSAPLFTVLTASMATVAGTVMVLYASVLKDLVPDALVHMMVASLMSAPAAIFFAQTMMPSQGQDAGAMPTPDRQTESALEALAAGASEGVRLVIDIVGMLIVLIALVTLTDLMLGLLPLETPLSLKRLGSWVFYPFCFLMGIPSQDLWAASELMAQKTLLNEFVAYMELAKLQTLHPKTVKILTYAICGFSNLGSVGIVIGGLGSVLPHRKGEIARLTLKAMVAGTFATMMTGALIGVLEN